MDTSKNRGLGRLTNTKTPNCCRSKIYHTGEDYLDENAVPLIKELQRQCDGEDMDNLETALEKTLQGISACQFKGVCPETVFMPNMRWWPFKIAKNYIQHCNMRRIPFI